MEARARVELDACAQHGGDLVEVHVILGHTDVGAVEQDPIPSGDFK